MIYAMMIVFSTLFSAHHPIAFSGFFERYEGMWVLLSYLILMLGAYLFISTLKQLWLILGVWLAALCIISIIGLFQFIGVDIFQTTAGRFLILPSQYQSIANSLDFNFPKYWIYATLYNPNNVASMMALALPMTAVCFFLSQSKIRRIGFGVLTGLFALVLAGTHARGGWIAVICAALLLFGVFMRHDLLRYWKWLSALSLVAVIAFAVLIFWGVQRANTVTLDQHHADYSIQVAPEHLSERLIRHYGTLGSGRLYIWIRSLQMARETVLLGRGPDTFALYFPNQDSYKRFFNQPEAFVDKPHNLYIQTWLNLGGLATCAFLAMIILHAVRTFQLLTKAQPNSEFYMLSSGLYAGWFAYLVAAMFYDSVVSVAPAFWIIFGLSLAVNHQLDSAIKSEIPLHFPSNNVFTINRALNMNNELYYGDNLEVLRNKIEKNSIDLCYIDPPFNSKRNYFQIYTNVGKEDQAQAQAFIDTWTWNMLAEQALREISCNENGRYTTQTVDLMKGLHAVLGTGGLLSYLLSMTQRINEIQRVLKPTGSFYLHCDPTASHYLKLILDSIFCPRGGDYKNEIIWHYRRWTGKAKKFQELHDIIFFYAKGKDYVFNVPYTEYTEKSLKRKENYHTRIKNGEVFVTSVDDRGVRENDVWQIPILNSQSKERLGYPTQKPEALLERIIQASSNEGDVILDAYCGCGTTVAVAQRLKRQWIGIDITYQSIAVILKRMTEKFGAEIADAITLSGIPKDMASAQALALKKDDRLRKEFEKWAVLTYTNNQAAINEKKGADKGIDGVAYIITGNHSSEKVVFQVKSGKVGRGDIAKLRGDQAREQAVMAFLITLNDPTKDMLDEALAAGIYHYPLLRRDYPCIQIVTIRDMLEQKQLFDFPHKHDVLKTSDLVIEDTQKELSLDESDEE
ncbi:DNA methyltransferase [Chromatium okenii]|nr:DNA methyltransferase [Chromatium okenii]